MASRMKVINGAISKGKDKATAGVRPPK